MASHFFARAAERANPSANYGLARIIVETEEDEAAMIEAAKLATLAYRDLPRGQTKYQSGELRNRLLEKLGSEAQDVATRMAAEWTPLSFEGGQIYPKPILDYLQSPPSIALN